MDRQLDNRMTPAAF